MYIIITLSLGVVRGIRTILIVTLQMLIIAYHNKRNFTKPSFIRDMITIIDNRRFHSHL